jgi:Cu-Zn family superoxide dismutase
MFTTFSNKATALSCWLAAALSLAACEEAGRTESVTGMSVQARTIPAATVAAAETPGPRPMARAVLEPTSESAAHGAALFVETEDGLEIAIRVSGLEPGAHGLHLHENGDCAGAEAEAAGDHFAPRGSSHGSPADAPSEHHGGDLGNVSAPLGGTAVKQMIHEELTLHGEFGVVGRAVVVHEGEDDLTSQPSGDSGRPIACGVVRMAGAPGLTRDDAAPDASLPQGTAAAR